MLVLLRYSVYNDAENASRLRGFSTDVSSHWLLAGSPKRSPAEFEPGMLLFMAGVSERPPRRLSYTGFH